MASSPADLEEALIAADAAGDEDAARFLAAEIERLRGEVAAPATDKEQPLLKRVNAALRKATPQVLQGVLDLTDQAGSAAAEGVAGILNVPGSLIRAVGEAAGVKPAYLPMTQEEIEASMVQAGITSPQPKDGGGRIIRRAGREVASAATIAVPILKAAQMGVKGAALVRPAIEAARASPGKFVAAELGAAAGGGAGAGVAKEVAPESTAAEITGLLIGTATPAAAVSSLRALVRGGSGTRNVMQQSIKEFAEAGTTPTVGMATRRRFNEAVEAGLAILPGSSGRMAVYAEKTARQLYDRVDAITSGIAPLRSSDAGGVAIKKGIESYVTNFKSTWRKLDAIVSKSVAPNDILQTPNTRAAIVGLTDPANAETLAYPQLANIAKNLDTLSQGGQMTYQNLRTLRSSIGGLIPDSYAHNVPQGMLNKLYKALSDDLHMHLERTSPNALAAFDRSRKYYTAAMGRLEKRLTPVTSSDIPERVFLALERSGHAGRTVINAAKRAIGKDNWDVVAGTVFQRMGMAQAGAQDVAGEIFSVNAFLTNWNKYARHKGTMEALLGGTSGGSQFAKDMTAVAKVAERFREAGRVFANPSGTARAIANIGLGTSVVSTALGGQFAVMSKILGIATLANFTARGFTNPAFVRFLARTTDVPQERLPGLVTRLGAQMASEPEHVQIEVAGFLDRLSDEFSLDSRQRQDAKK